MSLTVSAPVLWDGEGNFLNGALVGIEASAIVVGYVNKPSGPSIPFQANPSSIPVQCLQLKDRRLGTLYTTLTLPQWQAAANTTNVSPPFTESITASGDTTFVVPAKATLMGVNIISTDGSSGSTLQFGTTPGGSDISGSIIWNDTSYTPIKVVKFFSVTEPTTIYISFSDDPVSYTLNYEIAFA